MALGILITQCLQEDFVAPVAPHERLPNALHVGREEARRLLGPDAESGPLGQLMHWAREQGGGDLEVIHVRDWHDPDDPAQASHLERFGLHCIHETPGARLVVGEDEVANRSNEQFVDSITLNDFEGGTNLAAVLDEIRGRADAEPIRVGVVGVWTEAKVSFLCYELLTRCGVADIATCSALTASASRTQHFIALEQLRKILGVRVFDSVGEFSSWLVPDGTPIRPPDVAGGVRPHLLLPEDAAPLTDVELDVVSYLYRDSSRVTLDPLGGGFSGARVFRVQCKDALGHEQASSVLKTGPRQLIASERVAFEQVESILGNDAPSVRGFADFGDWAGLKYAYAAMGNSDVRTFKQMYETGAEQARIDAVLRHVYEEVLGRFYAVAQYERLPLFDYYTFDSAFADSVRANVADLVADPSASRLRFGDYEVPNVADFYGTSLDTMPRTQGEYRYVSYVHGDLNGANILLDGRDNVWLIDFFHAHRGHVLKDIAKLENDLLYVFTTVESDAELSQALEITRALRRVKDLRADLPPMVDGLEHPKFKRAWRTLRTLRSIGATLVREDRDPIQLSAALLRYAVHTMSFDESSTYQRRWALAAAGGWAEDIELSARDNEALRLDWLETDRLEEVGEGRIALTICPGRKDRSRSLTRDLETIASGGVKRLLCLLTSEEMEWADVADLGSRAETAGLRFLHEPILDQSVPTLERMDALRLWLEDAAARGEHVLIHCMGGLGRSGTVAASLLAVHGASPEEAIAVIRKARGPRAVETPGQETFVKDYARRG